MESIRSRKLQIRPTRRSHRLAVEDLEERRLPSQAFQPILTIGAASGPTSNILSGPSGVWIGVSPSQTSAQLEQIGPDGSVTAFPITDNVPAPGLQITSLTNGPDGDVDFEASGTDATGNVLEIFIGYATPAGQVTEFPPIPVHNNDLYSSTGLVSGPGGDLWFGYTDLGVSTSSPARYPRESFVDQVTTTGAVTVFSVPSFGLKSPTLDSIAAGPDGNLWFTENSGKRSVLSRMTPTGSFTRFSAGSMTVANVANGPNGTLIAYGPNSGGQNQVYAVSTSGALERYAIPASIASSFQTYLGAADGSLWFSDGVRTPLKLGKIAGNGAASSYTLTGQVSSQALTSIAGGTNGDPYLLGVAKGGTATLFRVWPTSLVATSGAGKAHPRR